MFELHKCSYFKIAIKHANVDSNLGDIIVNVETNYLFHKKMFTQTILLFESIFSLSACFNHFFWSYMYSIGETWTVISS